ncbi:Ank1 [Symbiodinium sp. CCMP2592]|nr:Ank1 [Symbiodinium sp. CCMP2592]
MAFHGEFVEIIGNVRNLKYRLESLCGMSRFRQRLLKDDEDLEDDVQLEPGDFQLVLLHFCRASEQQVGLLGRYAKDGEEKRVEEMLMLPQNPDLIGSLGMTPLCLASQAGHGRVVELLLEASADKNKACGWATPLRVAAQEGHAEIVRVLLEARAETEGYSEARGDTPLGLAASEGHREVVRLLLEAQADSNRGGPVYARPGHHISSSGCGDRPAVVGGRCRPKCRCGSRGC